MVKSMKRESLLFLVQLIENNYAKIVINLLENVFLCVWILSVEHTQNKKYFSSLLLTR